MSDRIDLPGYSLVMRYLAIFVAQLALIAQPARAALANPTFVTPDLREALHCAAALALTADEQKAGTAAALALPPLEERGKRYFALIGARAIDEAKLTREAVRDVLIADVAEVRRRAVANPAEPLATQAQQCLPRLDAAVPPAP